MRIKRVCFDYVLQRDLILFVISLDAGLEMRWLDKRELHILY